VDFVIARRGGPPTAIECKWSAGDFDPVNLLAFRRRYTEGENYVVASDIDRGFSRTYNGLEAKFVNLSALAESVAAVA
jgi:hypothetical protein